ncbi:MAG: cyclic nucleotide-binding domain-containing protein [Myxococcota bacterium]
MKNKDPISMPGFGDLEGVELMQKLPLFKSLTFDETSRLCSISRVEERKQGDVVIEEESLGQALYIISSGRMKVSRGGRPLGSMGPGELFGEMSLIDDHLTSARVEAEEDAKLVSIPRGPFEKLIASDVNLALKIYKAFCRTLSERLRRANSELPDDRHLKHGVR